jgi:hypothetical protein
VPRLLSIMTDGVRGALVLYHGDRQRQDRTFSYQLFTPQLLVKTVQQLTLRKLPIRAHLVVAMVISRQPWASFSFRILSKAIRCPEGLTLSCVSECYSKEPTLRVFPRLNASVLHTGVRDVTRQVFIKIECLKASR